MKFIIDLKYLIILSILGFIYIQCEDSEYTECGRNRKIDSETAFIFKAIEEKNSPGTWPWLISIGGLTGGYVWEHRCGGSLISRRHVITAAHCARDLAAEIGLGQIYIRAGDSHLQNDTDDAGVKIVQVVSSTVHPDYRSPSRYADIGVLELKNEIELSDVIRTICLPKTPTLRDQENGRLLVVTGWGQDILAQFGQQLQETRVQVFEELYCNQTHLGELKSRHAVPNGFSSDLFCAGDAGGSQGVCYGDSGSPAVSFQPLQKNYVLKGVVSGGLSCGTQDHPNIYVRVTDEKILTWVRLQISKSGDVLSLAPTVKNCRINEICTTKENCPSIRTKYTKLLSANKGGEQYKTIVQNLKKAVCNREKKGFCCSTIDSKLSIQTARNANPPTPSTRPTRPTEKELSPSWIPSMAMKECGIPYGTAFIVGGENTDRGEFPWVVLLGSNKTGNINWYCGGSLINRWYVVTAAHCKRPSKVRVGEWRVVDDTKPDSEHGLVFSDEQLRFCRERNRPCKNFQLFDSTKDCVDDQGKFVYSAGGRDDDCGPPHQDFSVAGYIDHPEYTSLLSGVVINDIALIKLDRPVRLESEGQSNMVPICLPIPGTIKGSPSNIGELGSGFFNPTGLVVGWGKTYDGTDRLVSDSVNSVMQKKLQMPLLSNDQCGAMLSNIFKVDISEDIRSEHHICAVGVQGQDSCDGDTGGPLIYRQNANSPYWLVGIGSFGTKTCGIGGPPVFTRVTSHVSWIRQNLT